MAANIVTARRSAGSTTKLITAAKANHFLSSPYTEPVVDAITPDADGPKIAQARVAAWQSTFTLFGRVFCRIGSATHLIIRAERLTAAKPISGS